MKDRKSKHLTLEDRNTIQQCLDHGMTFKAIAAHLLLWVSHCNINFHRYLDVTLGIYDIFCDFFRRSIEHGVAKCYNGSKE